MADIFGWLGCLCFALCGIPQAWKSYKDGHSFGLTYAFITMWLLGEVFYIGGALLKFGWIGWIMWNCLINMVAILVIAYYRLWPRAVHTRSIPVHSKRGLAVLMRRCLWEGALGINLQDQEESK